jgi:hypothetical protein
MRSSSSKGYGKGKGGRCQPQQYSSCMDVNCGQQWIDLVVRSCAGLDLARQSVSCHIVPHFAPRTTEQMGLHIPRTRRRVERHDEGRPLLCCCALSFVL